MYGMFLPILFPICAFGVANYIIVDMYALTYFHKKPPMWDEDLNNMAFSILKGAPLLMFFFGYWAMGNAQIFMNRPSETYFINRAANPKHNWIDFSALPDQSHLALLGLIYWLIRTNYEVLSNLPVILCGCCHKDREAAAQKAKSVLSRLSSKKQPTNEQIPLYWRALPSTY